MFRLDGQVALITGATGGIGREIAKTMHAAGATVVITGTREEALERLEGELGVRVHKIVADLKDVQSVKDLVATANQFEGRLDILLCNAGITRDGLMMRMSDEDFQEVIDVNLKAPFILMREAIKIMSRARYGRIIYISSIVGRSGNFGQANYAASKAGGIGMVKSAALETATRNITVNCIAPGFIETPMTDSLSDEVKKKIIERIPMGRIGSTEDIAASALYLSSKEAGYITGAVLDVNGGMYM